MMRIDHLSRQRDAIPTIARWHFDQWGLLTGYPSEAEYTGYLRQAAASTALPTILVARSGEDILGSASLVRCDMQTRIELTPWLAQVYVSVDARGQGVGAALVRAAAGRAGEIGFPVVYLYTSGDLPAFYARLGWTTHEVTHYLGKERTIMELAVGAPSPTADAPQPPHGRVNK